MAAGGFYHDLYMSQFRGGATPVASGALQPAADD